VGYTPSRPAAEVLDNPNLICERTFRLVPDGGSLSNRSANPPGYRIDLKPSDEILWVDASVVTNRILRDLVLMLRYFECSSQWLVQCSGVAWSVLR
jgi:hypothetical protein